MAGLILQSLDSTAPAEAMLSTAHVPWNNACLRIEICQVIWTLWFAPSHEINAVRCSRARQAWLVKTDRRYVLNSRKIAIAC
jgi:hypothetical protein